MLLEIPWSVGVNVERQEDSQKRFLTIFLGFTYPTKLALQCCQVNLTFGDAWLNLT